LAGFAFDVDFFAAAFFAMACLSYGVEPSDARRRSDKGQCNSQGYAQRMLARRLMQVRGGKVAPKYRDPKNSANTWTGRGRMPRWLAAATKGSKAKVQDYLIK
jgi:DNA-binding protein H-NS